MLFGGIFLPVVSQGEYGSDYIPHNRRSSVAALEGRSAEPRVEEAEERQAA